MAANSNNSSRGIKAEGGGVKEGGEDGGGRKLCALKNLDSHTVGFMFWGRGTIRSCIVRRFTCTIPGLNYGKEFMTFANLPSAPSTPDAEMPM